MTEPSYPTRYIIMEGELRELSRLGEYSNNFFKFVPPIIDAIRSRPANHSDARSAEQEPSYEDLVEFARWAQSLQPAALEIMERHNLVIDELDDPMQKLAFTFYCNLVEIEKKARHLFEKKGS